MTYVNRPHIDRLEYEPFNDESSISSRALLCLYEICRSKNISVQPGTQNQPATCLPRTLLQENLYRFCLKATHLYEQLGEWAVEYFIRASISSLETLSTLEIGLFADGGNTIRILLLNILKQGPLLELSNNGSFAGAGRVSSKVERLLAYLSGHDSNDSTGLVFVQQRVTVSVLCTLLSTHPCTKEFRCATFVGLSNNPARRYCMGDLLDLKAQRETLTEFRAGRKDLIVTTDALEEGIDVTACNLVISFDPPANLKSFIQRRGRARQETSDFAVMFPRGEKRSKIDKWRALEEDLIRTYQDDLRKIEELTEAEGEEEVVLGRLETKTG
jgi:hypothetical protein